MHHHHPHDHFAPRGRFFERLSVALFAHADELHGHRHGHGLGPRGSRGSRGFGSAERGGFGDDAGFTRTRKLSSDDLQLLLLALLADRPSHGYELSRALEERSSGFYKPSPGMIYPALTYLEEIGHATVEVVSNKKSYQLAPSGRELLEANRGRVDAMFAWLEKTGRKLGAFKATLDEQAAGDTGREVDGIPAYVAARRELRGLLIATGSASVPEQRRIAAILRRAAAEIRGDAADPSEAPE